MSTSTAQVLPREVNSPKWAIIDGNGKRIRSNFADFRAVMALLRRLGQYNTEWSRVDDQGFHLVPYSIGRGAGLALPRDVYYWVKGDVSPSARSWMNLFSRVMDIAEAERDELISLREEVARLRAEKETA